MVYTRENGYGAIDINGPEFQLGQRYYQAQVMFSELEAGQSIPPEKVKDLIKWYCELVFHTGELRADYRCMVMVAEGKAEFRER